MTEIKLMAVPMGDGSCTLECSECGPLGLVPEREAATLLQGHLNSHLTGVPA